ncbi:MAG: amidohydrolase family protein [Chloroflexi bacterium]|nr:amidohydrolase family protein [Chloroflexota bacterium]
MVNDFCPCFTALLHWRGQPVSEVTVMPKRGIVVDADGHVMESFPGAVDWVAELEEPYKRLAPRYFDFNTGGGRVFMDGKIWAKPWPKGREVAGEAEPFDVQASRSGMWVPDQRIKDMDLDGIDVSVSFGGTIALAVSGMDDAGLALAISRAFNNWLSRYCKAYPDRLKGVAVVPFQSPAEAAKEVRRAVHDLGLCAVAAPTHVRERPLSNDEFMPIYAEIERQDVPLCVHAVVGLHNLMPAGGERHGKFFFGNLLGFPTEIMQAVASVVCEGVMDRFPKLRVGFMEGGAGWLPYLMQRMDEHYEIMGRQVAAKHKPSEYVRGERFFISADPEEEGIPYVMEKIGAERVVYLSDYWHYDAKFPGSVPHVLSREDMTPAQKRLYLGENAARLYNLP